MAITIDDLKLFQSERMTDNADGGGRMSPTEIVAGGENQIFSDVSDVDRAAGDVSIRKIYAAVVSPNTEPLLDAGVCLLTEPEDPAAAILGFSTGDVFDERADIAAQVEQYRSRGIYINLRLISTHYVNQRIVHGYILKPVNMDVEALFYNQVISLASENLGEITHEQFVKVMRVRTNDATYTYMNGGAQEFYDVLEVTLDITYPLQYQFEAALQSPDGGYVPPTIVRTTQVVAPLSFIGISDLAVAASADDTVIEVADTTVKIVPIEYQDFGANAGSIPEFRRISTITAPDGFSATGVFLPAPEPPGYPPINVEIDYLHGGQWIRHGQPNAARFFQPDTISFPLRPDTGSAVYYTWQRYLTNQFEAGWEGTDFVLKVAAPMIEGSVIVQANKVSDDSLLESTADAAGVISGNGITGAADYASGLVTATFPEAVKSETFTVLYRLGGFVPQSPDILGIDSTRLPNDGRMPIYSDNQLVLIHHTDEIAQPGLVAYQVIDCGRTNVYRVSIIDANQAELGAGQYTLDRPAGIITMSPTLDLAGFTGPYSVRHTIADLSRINRVNSSTNEIALVKALSRNYPVTETKVSSVLYIGTMQARVTNLFAQSVWTGAWSDERIGSEPLAQYNDAQWPIIVSNLGTYPDRLLIQLTSNTDFQVIGENFGVMAIGDTMRDCIVLDSLTGQPILTIPYQGWGSGWSTGNCLRLNLIGARYPVDLIRAIQPSAPSGLDIDSVELLLLGNVNA